MISLTIITIIFMAFLFILYFTAISFDMYGYVFLSTLVIFYYAMCLYCDYVLFGMEYFYVENLNAGMNVFDIEYLYICILYLSFLVPFLFVSKAMRRRSHMRPSRQANSVNKKRGAIRYYILLLFITASLLLYISQSYGVSRNALKASAGILKTLHSQTIMYLVCIILLMKKESKVFDLFILLLFGVFAFVSFEREHILVLFLIVFYLFGLRKKTTGESRVNYLVSGSIVAFMTISLSLYKQIISLFNSGDLARDNTVVLYEGLTKFSFTGLDPAVTLLLLKQYFHYDIYQDYHFSYIVNTTKQFFAMLGVGDQVSLGNYATNYYNGGVMGTGFSMLLESMLNFSYLGPLVAGGLMAYLFHKLNHSLTRFGMASHLIASFVMVKLLRTEFAVLLKLYVFPILIAVFIINIVFKAAKNDEYV